MDADDLNPSMTSRTEAEILLAADRPDATYRELADGFRVLKVHRHNALQREALARSVIEEPVRQLAGRSSIELAGLAEGGGVVIRVEPTVVHLDALSARHPERLAVLMRQAVWSHLDKAVETIVAAVRSRGGLA